VICMNLKLVLAAGDCGKTVVRIINKISDDRCLGIWRKIDLFVNWNGGFDSMEQYFFVHDTSVFELYFQDSSPRVGKGNPVD